MKKNNIQIQFRLWYGLGFLVFGFFASTPLYILGLLVGAVAIPKWWEVLIISFIFDIVYTSSVQGFQALYFLLGLLIYGLSWFIAVKTRVHSQESYQFIRV